MARSKNWKKHKMLEILIKYDQQTFDEPHYYGGLKSYWLNKNRDKYLVDSEDILNSLHTSKDALKIEEDEIPYEFYYKITDKGRNSYYEQIYLNKIWYRNRNFWIYIVSLSISLGALTVSIIALVTD